MKTEDLIQRLGTGLRPVRPLAPPWKRASIWLACAAGYVLVVMLVSWMRRGTLPGIASDPVEAAQQLALIGTALVAAPAAFASVVPGAPSRGRWLPLGAVAVVMATLAWGMVRDAGIHGEVGVGREADWPCVISIAGGAAILWGAAMAMLRRGAPLLPGASGLLAGLAAVSLANVEACVTRSHAFSVTVLVWHGSTSVLIVMVAVAAGRRILAWRPPTAHHEMS